LSGPNRPRGKKKKKKGVVIELLYKRKRLWGGKKKEKGSPRPRLPGRGKKGSEG